ncbi:MAG: ribonuclease HII [Nanoarchaeota archaeon]|nr:ribonuclease HII [Nanoarchaeota archaeon]
MRILGIDEAGRGPVIGPLVMAGVVGDEKKLKALGAKDSKMLTPKQREDLFEQIKSLATDYKIVIIPPAEIDAAVLSKNTNLNWLEADHAAEIINALKPDRAIVDCPSNNLKKYTEYLVKKLTCKPEMVVEHKADANYPSCSAASILAKVTRDREIEKLEKKVGPLGSGYPSDPTTQAFLKRHYLDYPGIFRKSWESYKRLVEVKKQRNLGEF